MIHLKLNDMKNIYKQIICPNCLQLLVNGESNHTEKELTEINNTLDLWAKDKYYPIGMADTLTPYFSWSKCELCNGLAGDRYEYNFIDKK